MTVTATLPRTLSNATGAVKEYSLELETIETDENGAPWVRRVPISLQPGASLNVQERVNWYSQHEEPYRLVEVVEIAESQEF